MTTITSQSRFANKISYSAFGRFCLDSTSHSNLDIQDSPEDFHKRSLTGSLNRFKELTKNYNQTTTGLKRLTDTIQDIINSVDEADGGWGGFALYSQENAFKDCFNAFDKDHQFGTLLGDEAISIVYDKLKSDILGSFKAPIMTNVTEQEPTGTCKA